MAIPLSQLETWSHQGAIQSSRDTYNTIKATLEKSGSAYAAKDYEVFLQGSYCNDTNIYAESDVDVIIRLNDCFQSDRTKLTPEDEAAWNIAYSSAAYTHVDFKTDVISVLKDKYGADVVPGDKAVMIEPNGSRRKADVITAIQFKRYYRFKNLSDQTFDLGICIYDAAGNRIANYPKQHSENLTKKHKSSGLWLKPMVRIMKNIRTKLAENKILDAKNAPSYYIEGLMYNIPDEIFSTNYSTCFVNAINWIQNTADKSDLVCANEQYYLLRDSTPACWPQKNCDAFLDAVVKLWTNW